MTKFTGFCAGSVLLIALSTGALGQVTAQRTVSSQCVPGSAAQVTLDLQVDEAMAPNGVIVVETLPAGWTWVGGAPEATKAFDPSTREVQWVFFGSQVTDDGMDIQYSATPPADTCGKQAFDGVLQFNAEGTPQEVAIAGDTGCDAGSCGLCGNGGMDSGEQCDEGAANGTSTSCCASDCKFKASSTTCRSAGGPCDIAETCTGSSGTCPADAFAPSSTVCRPAAGQCDEAESCTGSSTSCPPDTNKPDGIACDDGQYCNGSDSCSGGSCSVNAGSPCPGADGDGDCSESCNEAADSCTANDPDGSSCDDGNPDTEGETCANGRCGAPTPTFIPTPSCSSPPPGPAQVVGCATGKPGKVITVDITLMTGGEDIAGTENVIGFDSAAPILGCQRNEAIGREATNFSFRPSGCTAGTDCDSVKALVLSFSNLDPIPDGAALYSCDVQLPQSAGCWSLTCESPGASDPVGAALTVACADGQVCTEPTPIPEADTPTNTPTDTPGTPTDTPTVTVDTHDGGGDGSCQIAAPGGSQSSVWLFLAGAAALLLRRRRRRWGQSRYYLR